MRPKNAIILAAGRGQRMGEMSKLRPKGLIEIEGKSLVRRSVDTLKAAGVDYIRIVTGHLHDHYEAAFGGEDGIDLVFNPDFASTGSLQSLAVGLRQTKGPVIILESDIIYEPRSLDPLSSGVSGIVVSGPTHATDEHYVWTTSRFGREDQLLAMSKAVDHVAHPHLGEMSGIQVFDAEATPKLAAAADRLLRDTPDLDYEPGMVAFAQENRFDCWLIPDLAVAEIDNQAMLTLAEQRVWPKIKNALAKQSA